MKRRPLSLVTSAILVASSSLVLVECVGSDPGADIGDEDAGGDAPGLDTGIDASNDAPQDDATVPCVIVEAGVPGQIDTAYQNGVHFVGNGTFALRGATVDATGRVHAFGFGGNCLGAGGLDFAAVRLAANGALDTAYGDAGTKACVNLALEDVAWSGAVDVIGRLVIAGVARSNASAGTVAVARLTASGALDPSFNPTAGAGAGKITFKPPGGPAARYAAFGVAVDGDKIVVVGGDNDLENQPATPTVGFVTRLNADGTFDPTFTTRIDTDLMGYWAAVPLPGGGLLIAGAKASGTPVRLVVRQLDASGAVVQTFGSAGTAYVDIDNDQASVRPTGMTVAADGKIVVAGTATAGAVVAARFNAGGQLDPTFGTGGLYLVPSMGSNYRFNRASRVQCDGKVLLGGNAAGPLSRIVRLTPGGAPDPTFADAGTFELSGDAGLVGFTTTLIDPRDGRILLVGAQPSDQGPWVFRINP